MKIYKITEASASEFISDSFQDAIHDSFEK